MQFWIGSESEPLRQGTCRANHGPLGDQAVLQNNALEGKTALICGASRGIGAATCSNHGESRSERHSRITE